MGSEAQGSRLERAKACLRWLRLATRELSRYLIYLRVPLLLLAVAVVAFLSQQVSDVLLAMALEPEWGAFGLASLAAAVFGTALWFSARTLSERRWMFVPAATGSKGRSTHIDARPLVHAMPEGVVWWLPRILGMAPALLMAVVLLWRVGGIGVGRSMAVLLSLEAAALLWLFYARTRLPEWLQHGLPRVGRIPFAMLILRLFNRPAITVKSGLRFGLFSARTELALMAIAWMILALISVPIARAAYGPWAGGSLHLYVVLVAGAVVLALDRLADIRCGHRERFAPRDDRVDRQERDYWVSFALLLLLALLLPLLITASGLSGVAIPRYLGSIAILYASLSIFTVFASGFFLVGTNTGFPLLSLLLITALLLASFRINDNHAVRLLAGAGQTTLPDLQQSFDAWLSRKGRREAIEAPGAKGKWPIYVVSAQGGGVYAAYHAAKALALLSREVPAFADHLFAISGVSGGSVGSTLYVNALRQAASGQDLVERIDQTFDQDHLSTVLAAMLFPDATQRFYPVPVPAWDRALGLELSFSDGGSRTPAPVSLEGSFYGDQKGPFLVLNTTQVESGRRLLLSPFHFESDATFHVPNHGNVRFSTAAVMSARFPLITSYAFFDGSPEQRQRRTVDGGYYDNSGAVTAEEIVQVLKESLVKLKLDEKAEVIPIAIVGISNFQSQADSDTTSPVVASSGNKPLLTFSAVDALFAAREARVAKALSDYGVRCGEENNKGLCITLQTKYRITAYDKAAKDAGDGAKDVPEDVKARNVHEGPEDVRDIPLGWTLSCQSREFISNQLAVDGKTQPPCLSHQRSSLPLVPAGPVAGELRGIPSFAEIVQRVREEVTQAGATSEADGLG